ncbi:uncharacterized protein KIAA1671 homolog [Gadus macrocephalus]|uniref:uncharacterized protein KIAA1671 homolog n=1 Tax=Gadus macrocephalus TaxID=80720 RepID=UPI0028CBABCB|nr:uncharacterized protein KIAA1671 homolog [Gadus macrocephalus]
MFLVELKWVKALTPVSEVSLIRSDQEEERAQERKEEAARRKQAEEEEVTRQQAVRDRERPAVDTAILISFDSEDVGQKSAVPTALLVEPTFRAEGPLEVPFDDFSVKKPVTEVLFDDFSVTPRRWGSKSRVPQTPEPDSGLEDVWVRRAPDVDSRTHQALQLDPVKESDVLPRPLIPCLVPQPQEEPRRPYEFPTVEQKKAEVVEEDEDEEVHEEKKEEREGGVAELKEKWNSFSAKGDGLDNEALLNNEPEQQYEDHEHDDVSESEAESPTPALEPHSDVHLDELDGVEPHTEPELPAFPESSAPLLDNKALRSKAELRKRMSQRTRRPRTRQSSPGVFLNEDSTSTPDWRVSDNTEETAESNEDEKEKRSVKGPPTSQRSPVFPGLESSHSALVAQLKKKTGGGGGGGGVETTPVKDKAAAAREELAALTPSPSMRSPRSAALLPGAARVLPPIGGKDDGTGSSPSWMQELKKKRMSQQESGS